MTRFYTCEIEKAIQRKKILFTDLASGIFAPTIHAERTVRYVGAVTRVLTERVIKDIEKLVQSAPLEEVFLVVTSSGGPTGVAMNFFDTMRYVLRPSLTTIGSGDVDSSGVVVFLAGERRYVTRRTTLLLHPAGRFFGNQRYTTTEMESMLKEDRLKDEQYARVIAERSLGALSVHEVLRMMESHTVLTPEDLVKYNLVQGILS